MLKDNLELVKQKIAGACRRSGRNTEDVLLLAVSKTKPEEAVQELYDAGHRDFGENYVQELVAKHEHLPKDIRWHMIGHLQRNKVKYIAGFIDMIHSVDTPELARTIEKEAAKHDRVIPVLIEVNVAGEESKFGVAPSAAACLRHQRASACAARRSYDQRPLCDRSRRGPARLPEIAPIKC